MLTKVLDIAHFKASLLCRFHCLSDGRQLSIREDVLVDERWVTQLAQQRNPTEDTGIQSIRKARTAEPGLRRSRDSVVQEQASRFQHSIHRAEILRQFRRPHVLE